MLKESGKLSLIAKRRNLMVGGVAGTMATTMALAAGKQMKLGCSLRPSIGHTDDVIRIKDGVSLYFKDSGRQDGPAITLCHGWPFNSDSGENQAFFLASQGFRVITHDRRGHGRSSQPWDGNDMDHYADDLAIIMETLGLRDVAVVGLSTGDGEVARYIGRHGTSHVSRIGLITAVTPLVLKTPDKLGGEPVEVFDDVRVGTSANRAQLFKDISSGPFYGFNRPGTKVSQGLVDAWWSQGMTGGFKNTYDSVKAFHRKSCA